MIQSFKCLKKKINSGSSPVDYQPNEERNKYLSIDLSESHSQTPPYLTISYKPILLVKDPKNLFEMSKIFH